MPLRRFRRQYEQLSQFERGESWAGWKLGGQLGEKLLNQVQDALDQPIVKKTATAIKMHAYSQLLHQPPSRPPSHRPPSLVSPLSSQTRRRRLAEGHLVLLCSSRVLPLTPIHRCTDVNRDRLLRPRGEHLNSAFALQRYTASTGYVMVWTAIA
ncbi:transposable element Tcb1 transposase [Trichonephila clavipes]|nr:transposable element Tcb1 transposase [Trichonephila clavipes]